MYLRVVHMPFMHTCPFTVQVVVEEQVPPVTNKQNIDKIFYINLKQKYDQTIGLFALALPSSISKTFPGMKEIVNKHAMTRPM